MTDPHPARPEHTKQSTTDDDNPCGLLFISDVQAMRRADVVSLHHRDGHGHISAGLTTWPATERRIFTATEQRLFPDPDGPDRYRHITVDTAVAGFDQHRRWHEQDLPEATATATIHAARLDDVWCSIAAWLRVGDIVTLHWRTDNNTQCIADAGLHRDEVRIGVQRGARRWMFLLDVAVGPDSPARMIIRPHS
ncbi:hypothetical protein WEI85_00675 [Actinomycetes bacterium KLBMP 9797]